MQDGGSSLHLVHDAAVHEHGAGAAELLHVGLQQNAAGDDASREVVVHDGDRCEKTAKEAAAGQWDAWVLSNLK